MSDISISELSALEQAMTPGKWLRGEWYFATRPDGSLATDQPKAIREATGMTGHIVSSVQQDASVITGCGCCGSPDASDADATGICAARNAMPVLLEIAKAALAWAWATAAHEVALRNEHAAQVAYHANRDPDGMFERKRAWLTKASTRLVVPSPTSTTEKANCVSPVGR